MTRRVAAAPSPDVVAARLDALRHRIEQAGRDPAAVRVVAVTKGFGPDAIEAALDAGVFDIGENYATELLEKAAALSLARHTQDGIRWHYLGAVQRRRVRDLAPIVSWWETVSRASEGEAIAARAPGATVLVQVDTTRLPGRNGAAPQEVPDLVHALQAVGLEVRGLMTVGPLGAPDDARPGFRTAARLARDLGLDELSMGMTADLEVALEEGATMVRVGRALFGERPPPPA
jgi:pyridoxal phosphate enzyme (YggS family)